MKKYIITALVLATVISSAGCKTEESISKPEISENKPEISVYISEADEISITESVTDLSEPEGQESESSAESETSTGSETSAETETSTEPETPIKTPASVIEIPSDKSSDKYKMHKDSYDTVIGYITGEGYDDALCDCAPDLVLYYGGKRINYTFNSGSINNITDTKVRHLEGDDKKKMNDALTEIIGKFELDDN